MSSVESAADYMRVMQETWRVVGRVMEQMGEKTDIAFIKEIIKKELELSIHS